MIKGPLITKPHKINSFIMTEQTPKVHKKNQGNHDGCADCLRQKKENEAFIRIYERLQEVDKKTGRMRLAVNDHKNNSENNRSFYHSYEQRVVNLPKVKDTDNPQHFEFTGYEIAASLVEKQAKSKVMAENLRLKEVLFRMQRENTNFKQNIDTKSKQNSHRTPQDHSYQKGQESLNQSFSSSLNNQSLYSNRSESSKLNNSQDTSDSCKDNSSTQSSSFNLSNVRNSMDLSKYNDLNLWLYQSEKNAKLEEELYLAKQINNRSMISKRASSRLPSIIKK